MAEGLGALVGVRDVLRLDRELERVLGARPRDAAACVKVLERAAFACRTDPAATEHWVEVELLDELVDCYEQLGRVDEAITVMRRALEIGWHGEPDGRCRIAELLMRDDRVDQATEIWQQVKADTPDDVWLYNNAGFEYAAIGDHGTALTWLTEGLQVAMRSGDPDALVGQLADLRAESLSELSRPEDQVQRDAERFLAHPPAPPPRRWTPPPAPHTHPAAPVTTPPLFMGSGSAAAAKNRPAPFTTDLTNPARPADPTGPIRGPAMPVALAWFPAAEYPQALQLWPELAGDGPAKGAPDHARYSRALQSILTGYADAGASRLLVAPIRITEYQHWCHSTGEDPATPGARARYAATIAQQGRATPWPPGRNQPCWCGSGRKYKQCCAAHP